jgi:EpsI family protein
MRGNIAVRVIVAAAIIGVAYLGLSIVAWGVQAPDVILPTWNIKDLPMQLGDWKGEDVKLDARLFQATGAAAIVERQYKDESGMVISLHFAVFSDPAEGIWHSPMHCYESAGWENTASSKVVLSETSEADSNMSLCTWQKGGDKALVGYWFQLGERRLFSRFDLGAIRWQMRGQKTWPALFKILISTPAGLKPDEAKERMISFSGLMNEWVNQPQHKAKDESVGAAPAEPK